LVLACFGGIRSLANRRLEPLFGGRELKTHELTDVERALVRAGLVDYKIVGGRVLVPAGLRGRYTQTLVEQRALPKTHGDVMREAVAEGSFLETREQRDKRYRVASERAMSLILRDIEGIDDAAVHYDEATIGGLHPIKEIKAMVAIRPSDGTVIDGRILASIRNAVAAYKAGLLPTDVTIIDLQTGRSWDGATRVLTADTAAQACEVQQLDLEREWNSAVTRVLRFIPGVEIETDVQLARNLRASPAAGARPLEASRIVVSIGVPIGYYRELWNQRNTANDAQATGPTGEELSSVETETREKIEKLIAGLAAERRSGQAEQDIQVVLFQRVDEDAVRLAQDGPLVSWLRNHMHQIVQTTVVLLAIALVIGVFRDLFYEDEPPTEVEHFSRDLRVYAPAEQGPTEEVESQKAASATEPMDTFVDADLTELVREHPQAASAMFKSWLEKAS
jgi:flagellar biosynthesis/type III secretory pathway M-ring protein FliF/YscJ